MSDLEINKDGTIDIEFGTTEANQSTESTEKPESSFKPAERQEPTEAPDTGSKEWCEAKAKPQENTEKPEQKKTEKPGYDYVEFEPEVQARFNRVYGQLKASDNNLKELTAQNKALAEKLEAIEREKAEKERQSQLTTLQREITDAQRKGDYEAANVKLREQLKLESKELEVEPISKATQRILDADTPVEAKFVQMLSPAQQEKVMEFFDNHPYAVNDNIKAAALKSGAEYWAQNPGVELRAIAQKIDEELHRLGKTFAITPKAIKNDEPQRDNINKRQEPSEVMTGDRTTGGNSNRVRLTQDQARVATMLFPDLDKDAAIKRYALQLQKIGRMS